MEIRVYISHAQENENWLREKDAVGQDNPASLLVRWQHTFNAQGWGGTRKAVFWYDREKDLTRRRSDGWKKGILAEIDRAHVAVLLITREWAATPFFRETALPRIRERHAAGELQLVPILVEPADHVQLGIDESLFTPGDPTPLSELLAKSESAGKNAYLEITQALVWAMERASDKAKSVQSAAAPSPAQPRSELPPPPPTAPQHEPARVAAWRRWPFWAAVAAVLLGLGMLPLVCGPSKPSHRRASAETKAPAAKRAEPEPPARIPERRPAMADAAPPEVKRPFSVDSGIKLVASGAAFAVGFGSDGESVAGLFAASRVELARWNLDMPRSVNQCSLPSSNARAGSFSPSGQMVAVTYSGARGKPKNGVALFEVATCKEAQRCETSDEVLGVAYPPSGDEVYLAGRGFVERWGLDEEGMKARQEMNDPVKLVASSGRKVLLLLGGGAPAFVAWNTDLTREHWKHEQASASSTISLAVSANGKLLLAGQTGRVSVLETGSGRGVAELSCPVGALRAVAFSPDGSLVAAGGDDFALCVWNLETKQLVAASKAARLDVRGIAFSPDGRKIAVAADHLFVFDVPR